MLHQTKKIELERIKADNGIKVREVYELEKSIQLTGRDMSYLSETESRQKIELDQCTQKLKVRYFIIIVMISVSLEIICCQNK